MTTPARRPWHWLAWLLAFLAVELPAAIKHTGGTLSETIPRWFPSRLRFLLLLQFLVVLAAHLYGLVVATLGEPRAWWSTWWLISASGLLPAGSVVYAELWERRPRVGLKDAVVRWLALRWLKGKADESRKEGGVMKLLDGWKSLILVLGFIAASLYTLATGQDVSVLLRGVFGAFGWTADSIDAAARFATVAAPLIWALWAAGSRLYKVVKQMLAGASPTELLSVEGYVKASVAEVGLPKTLAMAADVTPPVIKG